MSDLLLLKPTEVAAALGVSLTQARRMIRQGIIPSVSIGNDRRVPRALLEEWVRRPDRPKDHANDVEDRP